MKRQRLDKEMLRRGLAETPERAQEIINSGQVLVSGSVAKKPSRLVEAGQPLRILGPSPKYVSRAGLKLEAALENFCIEVSGRRCIDLGSSTGGFTDCLLQNGALKVMAVDVGKAQLHERLASDQRVTVLEQTDLRSIIPKEAGSPFEVLTADLAFISLRTVMNNLVSFVGEGSDMVLLVKPQFEARRAEVSKGKGIIRNPDTWVKVLLDVATSINEQDATILDGMVSPITGSGGNVEFLIHATLGTQINNFDITKLVSSIIEVR